MLKQRLAQGQPDSPELRAAVRDELNTRELLVREAKKKGLDKGPGMKTEMELASQTVLVRAYMADYLKAHPVSDEALHKEYDQIKSQMGDKEYKVRHILVDNQEEANEIIAALQKGEKFETLAARTLQGHRLEDARRRPRLEHAVELRQAVWRRHGGAAEGQVHHHAGADAVRLARHRSRRHS